MTAIKDLFDLVSRFRDEVKDKDDYERYRQVRNLVEQVEDDNILLKRENTALHEQLALARVKAAESLLAKEEENASLRIELRYLKSEAAPRTVGTAQPTNILSQLESHPLEMQIGSSVTVVQNPVAITQDDAGMERNISREFVQQTISPNPSNNEVLESYLSLIVRRSISAIRNDLSPRRAKTASRAEILSLIQAANSNEPIDPEQTFETLVSRMLLKHSYGDRFELTSNAYHLIGETK